MLNKLLLAALCIVFLPGVANAQEQIINGGFETGDLTGWTWTPTPYSDPAMIVDIVSFDASGEGASMAFRVNPGTDDDHWNKGFHEGGSLSQDVFMEAGIDYTVSLGAAAIDNVWSGGSNADGGRFRLLIDDEQLWSWGGMGDIAPVPVYRNSFEGTYVPSFTGMHTLEIELTRGSRNYRPSVYHYVDNVSIVPEPATMSLLAMGGLALLRRKK